MRAKFHDNRLLSRATVTNKITFTLILLVRAEISSILELI